jgi:large subunit ribosomal protein L10
MNRTEKQELINELQNELKTTPHVVLVDFRGLSVPDATEFRRKVKASGSSYRVVKNRLALRAAKGTPLEKLESLFEGTTGIAWNSDDPVVLAKTLVDFAKEHPALALKAGVVSSDQVLDAEGVRALSAMPGLSELRASFLALLQAPATKLVRLLGTPATQMARVLKAHQEKEGGE